MRIFDIDQKRIGVLNADAQTASWTAPDHHFISITENAFSMGRPGNTAKSHRIHPLIPKPNKVDIIDHITRYYHEQASQYDSFDLEHKSRRLYIERINELVAQEVKVSGADKVLHLACGTGRRPQRIQEVAGHDYKMIGVDVSSEMLKQAEERGLVCHLGDVLSIDFPPESFCHITMLYAFGHITSSEDRKAVLNKIHTWLKPGGKFMFDVFHLHNKNEWGPSALQVFETLNLKHFGYEKGDVFYAKTGGSEVAFLHYFEREEIKQLLAEASLELSNIVTIGYARNSGEIPENEDEGSFFITASKLAD
jgi:ubiquinone/menaquinone biosynthesis C-methylase UbiE